MARVNNNLKVLELLTAYKAVSNHTVIVGITNPNEEGKGDVVVFKSCDILDFIEGVKYRRSSTKNGAIECTDLRPCKSIFNKWMNELEILAKIPVNEWNNWKSQSRFHGNNGHALEAWLMECFYKVELWRPTNKRFDTAPDICINNEWIQVKFERATFSNATAINNAVEAIEKAANTVKLSTVEKMTNFYNEWKGKPIHSLKKVCAEAHMDTRTVKKYCSFRTEETVTPIEAADLAVVMTEKPYLIDNGSVFEKAGVWCQKTVTYYLIDLLVK